MFVIRLGKDNYHCDFCREYNAIFQVFYDENDFENSRYSCEKCHRKKFCWGFAK